MWLLDWLTSRFQFLQYLFDVLWGALRNVVENFFQHLSNSENNSYGRSTTTANIWDNIVRAGAASLSNLLHQISMSFTSQKDVEQNIKRDLLEQRTQVRANADKLEAKSDLAREKEVILVKLAQENTKLDVALTTKHNALRSETQTRLTPLEQFRDNFLDFLNNTRDTITLFVNDPIGFVAGILFEVVLDIILYLVADGLARPGLDIGNPPSFGKNGGPGAIGGSGGGTENYEVLMPPNVVTGFGMGYTYPNHTGLDILSEKDSKVFSAQSGKVKRLNRNDPVLGDVMLISDGILETAYYGLKDVQVREGQEVKPYTWIGRAGLTIHGKDNAIHFEVRIKGVPVDPVPLLRRRS